MRCSASSTGLEIFFFPPQNYFPLVILLCLISGGAVANHFNEVYITERWAGRFCRACSRATPNQTGISCERGWRWKSTWHACWVWEVLCLALGEIFSASQMSPQRKRGINNQNWFCSNKREIMQRHWYCYCHVKATFCFLLLLLCVHVCVCVRQSSVFFSENQQKPVISHVNGGWEANMRISGGNLS